MFVFGSFSVAYIGGTVYCFMRFMNAFTYSQFKIMLNRMLKNDKIR